MVKQFIYDNRQVNKQGNAKKLLLGADKMTNLYFVRHAHSLYTPMK